MTMLQRIKISPALLCYLALLLLVLPLRWLGAFIFTALLHEFGHLVMLWSLGIPISAISVNVQGAVIQTGSMTNSEELLCALSGPLTGALTAVLFRNTPEISVCALVQTAYNMVPVLPADGGRVLRGILNCFFKPEIAKKIYNCNTVIFLSTVLLVLLLCRNWVYLLLFVAVLALRRHCQKNSLQR